MIGKACAKTCAVLLGHLSNGLLTTSALVPSTVVVKKVGTTLVVVVAVVVGTDLSMILFEEGWTEAMALS